MRSTPIAGADFVWASHLSDMLKCILFVALAAICTVVPDVQWSTVVSCTIQRHFYLSDLYIRRQLNSSSVSGISVGFKPSQLLFHICIHLRSNLPAGGERDSILVARCISTCLSMLLFTISSKIRLAAATCCSRATPYSVCISVICVENNNRSFRLQTRS